MLTSELSLAGLNTRVLFLPLLEPRIFSHLRSWHPPKSRAEATLTHLVLWSLLHTPCSLFTQALLCICTLVILPCSWPLLCFLTSLQSLNCGSRVNPKRSCKSHFCTLLALKMSTDSVEKWNLWNWVQWCIRVWMWQGRRGTSLTWGLAEVAMRLWAGAPIHAVSSVSCRSPAWKEGRWQLWTMSWSAFPMWRRFWRTLRFWEKAWSKVWKLVQRNGLSETTERCQNGLSWSSLFLSINQS